MRLRRWAITAVTVLSVAAVSACGSSESNNNSDNPGGSNTSTPTTDDGSTGSGDSGSGDSSSEGTSVDALTAQALGAAMAKAATDAGSAHMVMTAGSTAGNVTMSGDIGGMGQKLDALALGMTMKIPGTGTAEMRIVDAAFYMKIPGLGLGSKWLKVPLDDPSNPLGSVYSQLATFTDPDALQASFSGVQEVHRPRGRVGRRGRGAALPGHRRHREVAEGVRSRQDRRSAAEGSVEVDAEADDV